MPKQKRPNVATPRPPDVTDAVIRLLRRRRERGRKTYGSSLHTLNGRDALQDLQEELADALQYVTQLRFERSVLQQACENCGSPLSNADIWSLKLFGIPLGTWLDDARVIETIVQVLKERHDANEGDPSQWTALARRQPRDDS